DFNGDGHIDIVIGNGVGVTNQLQINTGNGTFQIPIDLPGGNRETRSIVAVDVNGDGYIDLIIGNNNYANQLVLNNGGNDTNPFQDAVGLKVGAVLGMVVGVDDGDDVGGHASPNRIEVSEDPKSPPSAMITSS
ncbi:unnamed protein product, partial [marine sediment metagenome]